MFLKSEIQAFFAAKTEHNWMLSKCTRNSSFRAFKIDGLVVNGLTVKLTSAEKIIFPFDLKKVFF